MIKICGITTPESLEAAIAARASHIGLVFFPKSPRNVSIEAAAELSALARGTVKVVGLFVDPSADLLDKVRSTVTLDAIQLHGNETPAFVSRARVRHGIEIWKAIPVRDQADLGAARKFLGAADRILYDAKPPTGAELPGGSGLCIDWRVMRGASHPLPWLLAGGLSPQNVHEAIRLTGATGVDTSSGVESAPGVKDAGLISAFCQAARA